MITAKLVLLLVFLSLAQDVYARNACYRQADDLSGDALTIYRVTLGERNLILSDSMTAYQLENGLFLPLGKLSQALDFNIQTDPEKLSAEGWFLQPQRGFHLDLNDCSVTVEGITETVATADVITDLTDLYIHVDKLQTWFPLQFGIDTSRLILSLSASEPLPIEQRLSRQARWDRMTNPDAASDSIYPRAEVPYRLWDWPFIDVTAETRLRQRNPETMRSEHRYKVVATGDLLHMNTEFSAAGNESDPLRDVFLTLGRRDPSGQLLGPLHAREFALGDLGVSQDSLISNSTLGRGVRVSSFPLDRPEEFDSIDLRGELPIGWDVELYLNDRLIDFQSGSDRDRYDFTDVPLEFGVNEFRLVFYGPQGQVREETVRKVIGTSMVKPGQQHFRFTAMQERDDQRLGSMGPASGRIAAAYEQGISTSLSLGSGFKSLNIQGERHNYGLLNLNTTLAGFFSRFELAADTTGGHAASVSVFGSLAGIDINAETARFFDFRSERTLLGGPGELQSRSELRLNTRLPRWRSLNTSLGLAIGHEQWSQGKRNELETRFTTGNHRWTLTQQFLARQFSGGGGDSQRLDNRILFSTRFGPTLIRGEFDQEIVPEEQIHHVGISADWRFSPRSQLRFGLSRLPIQDVSTFNTGFSRLFRHFALGGSVEVTDQGDFMLAVTVSSGISRVPHSGDWRASSRPRTQTAAVAAQVFLDKNNNGRRDTEEPLIPDAEIVAARTGISAETDHQGRALLAGLPTHENLTVKLSPESLENPFWLADSAGRQMRLRPGRSAQLELPVVPTGTIEGVVYGEDPSAASKSPLSGVRVRLFATSSDLAQQTYSAYDGYYAFEQLPPGEYLIRIQSEDAVAKASEAERTVSIQGSVSHLVSSVDVVLQMQDTATKTVPHLVQQERTKTIAISATAGSEAFRTESWLRQQKPGHFTIQVMAMGSETGIRQFISQHDLQDTAAYFESRYQGERWFSVVYGHYENREQARAALASLPPPLQQASPWIRTLRSVHDDISALGKELLLGLKGQHIVSGKLADEFAVPD